MWLRFASWLALLLGTLFSASAIAQAKMPAELTEGRTLLHLSPHLTYFHDLQVTDKPEDAWRRIAAKEFQPLPDGKSTFGFKDGAFWFHARVINRNADEPRWMLVQRYALSDFVDIYIKYPDGEIIHHESGDHRPFSTRSTPFRHPNFRLDLPIGQEVDLLVRVESQSSMQVPLDLHTPGAFTSLARDSQFVMGIYYGILLALFVYNLVLWLGVRDHNYLWYLLHISAFGFVMFVLNGFGFEYLWPNSAWLADRSVPLSICIALVAMQQFARTFLELPKRFAMGNQISLAVIALFVLIGIASLWLPNRISTPLASASVILGVFWIAFISIVVLRRGYGPAKLFLIAWALFLTGTALIAALAFGLVPKNVLTEYGVQIGSALEMLLLSVALSHRYAALRNENERIVYEANVKLERKVAQRTQEVRSAMMQLEDAHRRLSESSRRDGLTGLYNRAYFHETFDEALVIGRKQRRSVSVLIIDLDHFKSINDRYGHLAGDECLRWSAQRIGQVLRAQENALLARFGGEEFVVALPNHDLRSAVSIAEAIRQKLNEEPCYYGEEKLRISASIGVHTISPDMAADATSIIDIADQALYSAKSHGRNCVRTSISAA